MNECMIKPVTGSIGPDKKIFERKNVIIFLPISLNMCLGAQKNRLAENSSDRFEAQRVYLKLLGIHMVFDSKNILLFRQFLDST